MRTHMPQAELAAVVDGLFRRWPWLVGFSVADSAADLVVSDVETAPWPEQSHELFGEIAGALLALIDEDPQAAELLRGRTFARTLH